VRICAFHCSRFSLRGSPKDQQGCGPAWNFSSLSRCYQLLPGLDADDPVGSWAQAVVLLEVSKRLLRLGPEVAVDGLRTVAGQ